MSLFRALALALALLMATAAAQNRAGFAAAKAEESANSAAAGGLIDINHAGVSDLRSLPGIGDAYSAAIVKHRPYRNKTQLRSKGVIPLAAYNKIKDKIIAKQ